MRLRLILGEVGSGLRRNASMFVSVVLVAMVSLFFLGAGLLAQREVNLAKGYWYDKVQVSVFMCTAQSSDVPSCSGGAVTPAQQEAIKHQLESMKPLVEQVYYESAQDAYARFKEQFAGSPYLSQVTVDSMPSSFRVKLSDPARYDDVVQAFDGTAGVEAVSDQTKVLDSFFKLLNVISIGAAVLAVVMVLCSILLISTTIRQVAFTRRRQVNIMRMVGASKATISLPFIIETTTAALVGAALAVGLLWAMVHFGVSQLVSSPTDGTIISIITTRDVWVIAPWLVGGALILALVTSWITLRRQVQV